MPKVREINQNFTVPNFISVLRIIIVPFFCYYFLKDRLDAAVTLIVFSGLTDAVDGFIARKFNQITELGKMLDPLADKLTQASVAFCLCLKYPELCPFLIVFLIKELSMLVFATRLITLKRKPSQAKWYGKVATILFYISTIAVVFLSKINISSLAFNIIVNSLMLLTTVMMVYAWLQYRKIYLEILASNNPEHAIDIQEQIKRKKIVNTR